MWPLDVLGGLLLSPFADLFIRTYAVKMRGSTPRNQAQYLRRICVPPLDRITEADRRALSEAFETGDVQPRCRGPCKLYDVDPLTLASVL